nr:hypothetical protein [Candidatus Omnitrophota bacterium]
MAMNKKEKDGIAGLKNDVGGLKSSMEEMKSSMEELGRHMGVLVEGLRSEVRLVAEQHGSIITKLEEHDRRFDVIDIDLKAIKGTLFGMSHKLDNHEVRICKLEQGD